MSSRGSPGRGAGDPPVHQRRAGEDSTDANDSSQVLRVTTDNLRILLAGDVEEVGQSHAVATVASSGAQVYRTDQHGSIAIAWEHDHLRVTTQRNG